MALLFANGFDTLPPSMRVGNITDAAGQQNLWNLRALGFITPTNPQYASLESMGTNARYPGGQYLSGSGFKSTGRYGSYYPAEGTYFTLATPVPNYTLNHIRRADDGSNATNGLTVGLAARLTSDGNWSYNNDDGINMCTFGFCVRNDTFNNAYTSAIWVSLDKTYIVISVGTLVKSGGHTIRIPYTEVASLMQRDDGQWHFYEFAIKPGTAASTIVMSLYIDGIKVYESEDVIIGNNTGAGAYTPTAQLYAGFYGLTYTSYLGYYGKHLDVDDFYISDRSGTSMNTESVGEMRIVKKQVTTDNTAEWTLVGAASSHHAAVDNPDFLSAVTDGTYLKSTEANQTELYEGDTLVGIAGTIAAVMVDVLANRSTPASSELQVVLSDDVTTVTASSWSPDYTTTPSLKRTMLVNNPLTGQPFTAEDAVSHMFGIKNAG